MRVVTLGGLGDVKKTGEGIVGPDMSFTLEEADAAAAAAAARRTPSRVPAGVRQQEQASYYTEGESGKPEAWYVVGEASSSSWITTLSPAAVWGMRIGLYGSIIGMTAVVAAAARKAF